MNDSSRQSSKTALAVDVWLLWIDAVGGYRLLQGEQFTIGGPGMDDLADIAVRSAWRRRMAVLSRAGDDFWLQSPCPEGSAAPSATAKSVAFGAPLPIEGTASAGPSSQPELSLHKPSPLSGTVMVTLAPPHRFVLPFDAMLLVDKTVLIGAERTNHIRTPQMTEGALVLAKRADGWWIRQACGTTQRLAEGERLEIGELAMVIRREVVKPTREKR
ncbi:MAG: hypothetical protein ACO1RT_14700 [Planctomycetaceae bacterium]